MSPMFLMVTAVTAPFPQRYVDVSLSEFRIYVTYLCIGVDVDLFVYIGRLVCCQWNLGK